MTSQAQIPTQPVLQAGEKPAVEAGAMMKHRAGHRAKKMARFFDALAAKDPAIKADLDQLKTRMMALTKEQMKALHALMWEENKNTTLDQLRLKMQGFLDAPSTFVAHAKAHLDKLQAMSSAEITAMADKFPPSTFKQLKQMIFDSKKAEKAKIGEKKAAEGVTAADDDEAEDAASADVAKKTPVETADTAKKTPAETAKPTAAGTPAGAPVTDQPAPTQLKTQYNYSWF